MKRLVMTLMCLLVLAGCAGSGITGTVENDDVKRTVKLDVKDSIVVKLEEESVFKMDKTAQMDAYADYYREFNDAKKTPGYTFEYKKSDDSLTIKTTVDFVEAGDIRLEKYFTKNENSANKIVSGLEDRSVDNVKKALTADGGFTFK